MPPKMEGWPNVGVEEAKLLPDERAEAPRMEGWPKVGWLGLRVEDIVGGGGRDEEPRMDGLAAKAEVD